MKRCHGVTVRKPGVPGGKAPRNRRAIRPRCRRNRPASRPRAMRTGVGRMASRRYKYRHRSRPAAGEIRAVLDGYAALTGARSAHTAGASADAGLCALPASATVPGVVSRLWEAATCADMTPSRVYLSRRGCWPGRHVRAPLPAESVRWLAREAAPERDEAAGWYGLPPGAAGAVGVRLAAVQPRRERARGRDPRCTRRARLPVSGGSIDSRADRRRRVPGRAPARCGRGDGPGGRRRAASRCERMA